MRRFLSPIFYSLVFCAGLVPASSVSADEVTGTDLYKAGRYGEALEKLSAEGGAGNVKAVHLLAYMTANGLGTPQDDKRAADLYRQAAESGYPPAAYDYALYCLEGVGTDKSVQAAKEWFVKAAQGGHGPSEYELGRLAEASKAANRYKTAADWYERSAQHGYLPAFAGLGHLKEKGLGVKRDPASAEVLYLHGAEAGDKDCQFALANFYASRAPKKITVRTKTGKERTVSAKSANADKAFHWYRTAAGNGHAGAMRVLADTYRNGWYGQEKDEEAARNWAALAKRAEE